VNLSRDSGTKAGAKWGSTYRPPADNIKQIKPANLEAVAPAQAGAHTEPSEVVEDAQHGFRPSPE
jgi:hypothetical protein